jgi:hypothetical protein
MKRTGIMILVFGFLLFVQMAQAQWTTAKRISWTSGDSGFTAIAVGPGDSIHVVWEDDTPGNYEIYYTKSTDGGVSWAKAQRITWTSGRSGWPSLAVDPSGEIHVAWEDATPGHYAVYYKNSTDGGITWSANKRLTWTSGDAYNAAITFGSPGCLHLAFNDSTPGNDEIYYKKSTDAGVTWATSKRLTYNSGTSGWPAIAVDSSGIAHVAWTDATPGPGEIYYKNSTDEGTTWSAAKRLTWTSKGGNIYIEMALDPSKNLHLVWQGNRPADQEIYYKKSTDGGATWATTKKLTLTTANYSGYPDIASDPGGNLHLVWEEETATSTSAIYYKMSTDGGASWTANLRLNWSSGNSGGEAVAADSLGNVHVVYSDNTIGQAEIYYKKFNK